MLASLLFCPMCRDPGLSNTVGQAIDWQNQALRSVPRTLAVYVNK